jgi:predicted nucleic acid-binding protein
MIVVDASAFIDLIFEYNLERTQKAENLFRLLEEKSVSIVEPEIFRIEFAGQIARRANPATTLTITEDLFKELNFISTAKIFDEALSIAFKTGSRAIDSFYIAVAGLENSLLVSNDKYQVESARRYGIEVYSLLHISRICEEGCTILGKS